MTADEKKEAFLKDLKAVLNKHKADLFIDFNDKNSKTKGWGCDGYSLVISAMIDHDGSNIMNTVFANLGDNTEENLTKNTETNNASTLR